MGSSKWKVGDFAIYLKQKTSTSPGPRAKDVSPATSGDTYSYIVEKYWVVTELLPNQTLKLRTRRSKEHIVSLDDPLLRKAHWWEKWLFASRFKTSDNHAHSSK